MVRHNTATRHIPIIMLTAVGGDAQRIAGLDMGADDYVEKPFSSSEVVSRVRAVLRRSDPSTAEAGPVLNTAIRMGPYFVVLIGTRGITVSKRAPARRPARSREHIVGCGRIDRHSWRGGSEVMLRELVATSAACVENLKITGRGPSRCCRDFAID